VFKSEHYWHAAYEQTVTKQVPKGKCHKEVLSGLKPGDIVMYNSYNVGKIRVHGLPDDMMIIRDIDILATGPASADIELGEFAMTR
jgi:co-chaperonin GroES (HSP10)